MFVSGSPAPTGPTRAIDQSGPFAWLAPGADDDDPSRFWALARRGLVTAGIVPADHGPISGTPESLAALGRELTAAAAPSALVIDDVHHLASEEVIDAVAALVGTLLGAGLTVALGSRVGDGDTGPNTGGMGAYAPLPWAPADLADEVVRRIVQPTVDEMARRGTPFTGLLYAGLALTADGPQVIEFNCRFGDPETQVVLELLRTPLAGLLLATATGRLAEHPPLEWADGAAVTVVIAAEGYPGRPRTGDVITGADAEGVLHAGTRRREDGAIVSAGGRVLSVVGTGPDLAAAREAAYRRVAGIRLTGAHHRTDIALRASRGEISIPTRA